jgi:DNA-binding GntR family transcriptional regulator
MYANPRSLTALVAERLKASIIDGSIKLGSMLSEKQVAKELGTSKTPVREAFVQFKPSDCWTCFQPAGPGFNCSLYSN